ncbi:selenoprotein N-like [Monodelphis domestica]|uniref:selenoprotein N-like n=1 Tax=Monodelphis domestica TaxID=13616 RepID=UPI0024E25E07|nr:selenoprotein N-like [Monodelphis domestica]
MDLPAAPGPPVLPSPQPRGLPPRRSRSRRDLALLVIMLAALLAAASRGYLGSQDAQASALRETALIPGKISFFFSALDVNRDMYISPKEFKPIAEIMRVVKPITDFEKTEELKEETSSQEEELAIVTPFEPLLLDTTSNSKTGFKEEEPLEPV